MIRLEEKISDDYWYMMDELWHDFIEKYGYVPLMVLFHLDEFKEMWLKKVRLN